jgi:hypothetical protein
LFRHVVTSKLTISYHATVIELIRRLLQCRHYQGVKTKREKGAAENGMKIYLLIMLIGTLLTAVHFTSAPEQRSKTLPQ